MAKKYFNYYFYGKYSIEGFKDILLEDVFKFIRKNKLISLDTETRPCGHYEEMIMLQLCNGKDIYVVDTRCLSEYSLNRLGNVLYTKNIIGVNLKFDLKVLYNNIPKFKGVGNTIDLFLLEIIFEGNLNTGASLAALAKKYLDIDFNLPVKMGRKKVKQLSLFPEYEYSKDTRKEFMKIKDEPFTPIQVLYGASDALLTYEIYLRMKEKLKSLRNEIIDTVDLEFNYLKCLVEMELTGIPIDIPSWDKVVEKIKTELDRVKKELDKYATINWNSPAQVLQVFKDHGLPVTNSVAETVLKNYKSEYEILKIYFEYKHLMKLLSSYGVKFYNLIYPDNRIRSDYWQLLITGRISSSKPNLQNIPREGEFSEFRSCFKAPRGYQFVISDYSGQEFRILAEFSGDIDLIERLNNGTDGHKYVASKIFNKSEDKITKEERTIAKTINFTIAYGGGEKTVSERLGIPQKKARKLINIYFDSFPRLKDYFDKKLEESLSTGYIKVVKGKNRHRYIKVPFYEEMTKYKKFIDRWQNMGWKLDIPYSISRRYNRLLEEYRRKVQNYPIQGTAALMTKLAGVKMLDKLKPLNAKICLTIHDEYIILCPTRNAEKVRDIVKECMESAGEAFCKKIVMKADPIISKTWVKG